MYMLIDVKTFHVEVRCRPIIGLIVISIIRKANGCSKTMLL